VITTIPCLLSLVTACSCEVFALPDPLLRRKHFPAVRLGALLIGPRECSQLERPCKTERSYGQNDITSGHIEMTGEHRMRGAFAFDGESAPVKVSASGHDSKNRSSGNASPALESVHK
jgi:hypothetical protein